jgi:NAD(P)-dependent dehydrogenase (short-subunit alcohol dehydrogenase family)
MGMHELSGKVAVVTGGASGIGLGIARALAAHGVDVVIADIEHDAAQRAASDLAVGSTRSMGVACDVSLRASVEELADRAWSEFGHVDIIVNNAGVFPPRRPLVELSDEDARWVLDVNVLGVLNGCAVFGRRFIDQGTPAHIVNTGSENSLGVPHTHGAVYTASKHAVLGLSDVLRQELPDFIGVSILCPGMVASDLGRATRNRQDRYGGPQYRDRRPPNPGLGLQPDDVGNRVVEAIERGDFYIVTHPPVRELVEERTAELLAAFDAQAPRFDGDEYLDTRAVMRNQSDR